ncbi:MAG: DUF3237 domain-containing protein [Ruminococcus sp.]|nr:DUF3237 domain-containing protein [Ruminococcus sp.]MBR1394016.1 DUF3237 domain-containing protein [Ruminococcus sp.]
MERLIIHVDISGCFEVSSGADTVRLLPFTGHCDGGVFRGDILPGGVDTQRSRSGQGGLSARYMLEGEDYTGQPCRIFIENEAPIGAPFTRPRVITDSKALGWLNTSRLAGRLLDENGSLTIEIGLAEDITGGKL